MRASVTTVMVGLLGALTVSGSVRADFLGLAWEDDAFALDGVTLLEDIGITGVRVINVYAAFDDPDDQAVGVLGNPDNPFTVFTSDGSGFLNPPGSSDRPPLQALAELVPELNADSFLTIGNRLLDVGPDWSNGDAFSDEVLVAPGTPGPNDDPWGDVNDNMAWTLRPSLPPPSGGPPEATPQSVAGNWPDNRVLLFRLVVNEGVDIGGSFALLLGQLDGGFVKLSVTFSTAGNAACPGAGSCFLPNGSPGCADADCCELICLQDPACCDLEWDLSCAEAADALCAGVPTGACCFPSGTCSEQLPLDCLNAGGEFQGADTVCAPNPCPQPPGACCFPDGSCQDLIEQACSDGSGVFQGAFTTCTDVTCPPPAGACCLDTGMCLFVPEASCDGFGGSYQGDLVACRPGLCPQPTGACCFPDQSCLDLIGSACIAMGGSFQGAGVECVPDLCPVIMGECCFSNDTCVVLTAADCAEAGGSYGGDGTVCTPGGCEGGGGCSNACGSGDDAEGEPCGDEINGGCNGTPPSFGSISCGETICGNGWADGGTRDTDWYLISTNASTCLTATLSSEFSGVCFVVDGIDACAPVVVGQTGDAVGCKSGNNAEGQVGVGNFVIFVAPGVFEGVPCGSGNDYIVSLACSDDCGGPMGPCGPGSGDCCADGGNGTPGCDDVECCELICAQDSFCCDTSWDGICAGAAQDQCEACGGAILGACCFPDGSCIDGITNGACTNSGGTTWEPRLTCGDVACEVAMACPGEGGDCCAPGGNGTPGCDDVECCTLICSQDPFCCDTSWDGICAGAAIDQCEGCSVPQACCFPDGSCQMLSPGDCGAAGGTAQGSGVTCMPNPCNAICGPGSGDCFIDNGTPGCDDADCCNAVCAIDPFCCDISWDGVCAGEAADLCGDPGACCFVDGSCEILIPGDCLAQGGVFDGSPNCAKTNCQVCDLSLCPPGGALEGEPCGEDTNGGCNSTPTAFGSIACGQTICGNAWAEGGMRDTDWYLFTLGAPTEVTATTNSEFSSVTFLVDGIGACAPVVVGAMGAANLCTVSAPATGTIGPGDFVIFVANSGFDGNPCGGGNNYQVELNCGGGVATGACCVPGNACVELSESECLKDGGDYQGDGTRCPGGIAGYFEIGCRAPFEDISMTGIEAPNASNIDDAGDVVPMGFTFDFFDDEHETVGVCSNGYLTFGGDLSDFTNDPIPAPEEPNDLIAPWWDDWSPNQQGTVHYQTLGTAPNRRFISQWTDVPHFASGGSSTFQAVLYEGSNIIEFRYAVPLHFDSPTVGVENQDGTDGTALDETMIVAGECAALAPLVIPGVRCVPDDEKGACCFGNGACAAVTIGECAASGGTFQGLGAVCAAGLCPQPSGGCCFADASCVELPQAACNALGGNWQGPGTGCVAGLCIPVKGACCFGGVVCVVLTEASCLVEGGVYQGDNTVCVPGLCGR